MSKRTIVLLILDGWGIGKNDASNPLAAAGLPAIDALARDYPHGALEASGIAVGLPWGEAGNSEVGHLTIGAGRTVYQNFPRITLAIHDKSFFNNEVLCDAARHAAENKGALHLAGLVSAGNAHASLEHALALIELGKQYGVKRIRIHAFADGKDSPPRSLLPLLGKLPFGETVELASVAGRYYAMDRDAHWDRTEKTYAAMTGKGTRVPDIGRYIESHYGKNLSDEFIEPAPIGVRDTSVHDNDAIIFWNFRDDGVRQIALPLMEEASRACEAGFPIASLVSPVNLHTTTMGRAFPPETIANALPAVLAAHGKFQLRIAETEKYPHITHFF